MTVFLIVSVVAAVLFILLGVAAAMCISGTESRKEDNL